SAIPRGVGNQVDGDRNSERPGELQRFKVLAERNTFAMEGEALFVDRFNADEHVGETERLPEFEHLLVPQQHVAPRFEIVLFGDAATGDRLADGHPLFGLNEGDVIDDEDSRLTHAAQVINDGFGAARKIAAGVERPGAAEGAVPWTAPRKFDRRARIEHTNEVFATVAEQIPGGPMVIEVIEHSNRCPLARGRHTRWNKSPS